MNSKALTWIDKPALQALIDGLRAGKVAVGASDTVLGLLADASQAGFEKLNFIKSRTGRPYLVLIASKDKLANFAVVPESLQIENLMGACWPGPLTLILKAKADLPLYLQSKDGTIAVRVPAHEGLLSILPHFRGLFSTSANLAGEPVPQSLDELSDQILSKIDYVIEGDHPQSGPVVPSTILDCSGEKIKVVREGAYPIDELERICGELAV